MRRRLRAAIGAASVLVTVGVAAVAAIGLGGGAEPTPADAEPTADTVQITKGPLVDAVTVDGTIGFGAAGAIESRLTGTVTWLPAVGTTVRRGGALFRVDDRPVVLLYGSIPAYRAIGPSTKGRDVQQLEANLGALGYSGFTVDGVFSDGTAVAVKRWQRDLGLDQTGVVDLGQVHFGAGSVRVAEQLVRIGAAASGDVISATGTTRVVTIEVPPAEATWAVKGAKVTISLPNGQSTDGTAAGPGTPHAAEGGGQATVAVEISVADQRALESLAVSTVEVRYVVQERADVLSVPVSALVALAEGGYGLEVVENGARRFVAVEVGLFADGRVEVRGPDIRAGLTVRVPS